MSWTCFFDDPLFGDHSPLVLGWSDDQLWPIVEHLVDLMPAGLTDDMKLALASCARSIVAEEKGTGRAVHFPRGKESYRRPQRYRSGDPRWSWYYITRSMDILDRIGLIEQRLGMWCRGVKGLESIAWGTDLLMERVGPLINGKEPRALDRPEEVIVLRDRGDKKEIDYPETAATTRMRAEVRRINDALGQLDLRRGGERFVIPVGRRVFNGSFDRGGRFYCHGPSFQNIPAEQRRELELVIDGVAHPIVEIDYSNLHLHMAYREARKRIPRGDQYDIQGFDRGLVKIAVNAVLNADGDLSGIRAVAYELYTNRGLREASGLSAESRKGCHHLARGVGVAIKDKHHRIRKYFGSDCGAIFQRRDSDMAIQVMVRMIHRTRRCPLPVHDSFLVAEGDGDALIETMTEVARENKIYPSLKILRPGYPEILLPQPGTTYFQLEVTASALGKYAKGSGASGGRHGMTTQRGTRLFARWADAIGCRGPPPPNRPPSPPARVTGPKGMNTPGEEYMNADT